jgi:hypothetical protein
VDGGLQRAAHTPGRWCFDKSPMQTFLDSADWAREKQNVTKAA